MKQLVYGNQQCSQTVEELQPRVEVVAARVRGIPGVFLDIRANMLRRAGAYIANQGHHFQHLL